MNESLDDNREQNGEQVKSEPTWQSKRTMVLQSGLTGDDSSGE